MEIGLERSRGAHLPWASTKLVLGLRLSHCLLLLLLLPLLLQLVVVVLVKVELGSERSMMGKSINTFLRMNAALGLALHSPDLCRRRAHCCAPRPADIRPQQQQLEQQLKLHPKQRRRSSCRKSQLQPSLGRNSPASLSWPLHSGSTSTSSSPLASSAPASSSSLADEALVAGASCCCCWRCLRRRRRLWAASSSSSPPPANQNSNILARVRALTKLAPTCTCRRRQVAWVEMGHLSWPSKNVLTRPKLTRYWRRRQKEGQKQESSSAAAAAVAGAPARCLPCSGRRRPPAPPGVAPANSAGQPRFQARHQLASAASLTWA